MIDATELPPFTFEQKQALRECRFVTTYVGGSPVLAIATTRETANAVGGSVTGYQPDKTIDPERWEYEVVVAHPEATIVARELMTSRAA